MLVFYVSRRKSAVFDESPRENAGFYVSPGKNAVFDESPRENAGFLCISGNRCCIR